MSNEKEKKSIVKSIKISPLQEQQIMEQAEQKGMNFSEYMLDCALHNNQGITPLMAVKLQEMVNIVKDIADNLDSSEYIRKEELRQKACDFEGLCTPITPQEKYNKLEKSIGLFVEGGYEVWESLK
ncbi:MAG: hypothetical protein NC177_18165 [Ruminococcus flavefaciens]|nr:hypothetical protein [Ruminococcus flavefaciens]